MKGRSGKRHVLVTAGKTTFIGGGRRTYSRVGGKVTKRGAYKKPQKANFIKKRAAVVETKRKDYEDLRSTGFFVGSDPSTALTAFPDRMNYIPRDEELYHMNPMTYYWWSQGLSQSQHIGQSVTVKHLNQKIQVRFPQPHMSIAGSPQVIPQLPQSYYIYWGWIPAPRNLTGHTTPLANTETVASLDSYVNNRLKDYFNDRKDRLRFIPKKDSTLRIVGKKVVRPDLRHQSSAPVYSGAVPAQGVVPDWFGEISWKFPGGGRKIWLEQSGNLDGGNKLIGMYPNYSWLPFCCLVNWNYSETKATHPTNTIQYMPSVVTNDIVYFTDS